MLRSITRLTAHTIKIVYRKGQCSIKSIYLIKNFKSIKVIELKKIHSKIVTEAVNARTG